MEPRPAPTAALAIEHSDGSSPATFKLTRRSDGKSLALVTVPSPYQTPVEGHPQSNLMRELRWYLEDFLNYPFPPETTHAEQVLDALHHWGTQAFNALFDHRDAGGWLTSSGTLQICSDDANILSWPWEALFDSQTGAFIAQQRQVERRINKIQDPPPLGNLPPNRINILLVVARPFNDDVRYRSISRPLVELIQSQNLPAQVTVLRPPTFDNLRDTLRANPSHYHVLHFDGHGSFGNGAAEHSSLRFRAPQGCLVFEDTEGKPDPKSASDLTNLLREHALPAVVLNACQSAALDDKTGNPFSTVAAALLQSGMRSVVAMAYSLYVSGAQVFLPAFYRRLFEKGNIAEAVRAGRQQMLSQKKRIGPHQLEDWLLPVLYQQSPLDFTFAQSQEQQKRTTRLPKEVLEAHEDYGFIGRDGPILEMERALHRNAPCILVRGLGGVGKTTLARGFLRWLDETGGLDAALWFDFRDIRTSEYVLNRTGKLFYGENFGVAKNKLDLLRDALKKHRIVVVWDNFESAEQNLPPSDRSELARFLDSIRGTLGKVIITSRSLEEWLSPPLRFDLSLGGLDGSERWEYCDTILRELGLASKVNRADPELGQLMNQLAGHPLAMRVVLPKLASMPASAIAAALRTNINELGLSEDTEQGRVFGALRFVERGLPADLRPLVALVALHESYLDADDLESMSKHVDVNWTRSRIDQLMSALSTAGLVKDIGQSIYEMHPLLTSYLRSQGSGSPEPVECAFVEVMGSLADNLAPRELHEQRGPFFLHGANLRFALELASRLRMDDHVGALTQSLAAYAQNQRNFVDAARLFEDLASHERAHASAEGEAAAYHQLGIVAQEQREFETAREWYLKSLAIKEKQGNLQGTATTYHQLGRIAEEQREFETAQEWHLKSLAIKEKQGNLHGAAISYHQLGIVAQEQREFETAREWYLKSLAISEKQGNLHGAASTYHQLGRIAEEQREFETAREWYLKSLAISEKQGDLNGTASTYHQLGSIAEEQREFETAREWYLKSLAISEKQGNLHGAASTYHQLGSIAQEQREFETAREWYLKSLTIDKKQENLHGAASTYHQLGIVAEEQREFETAREWYLKSLAISEKQENLHGAASTYHELGIVAASQREFETAREWYLKSLAIKEKQGNLHGAASSFGQLGILEAKQGNLKSSAAWFTRSIRTFLETGDQHFAKRNAKNFMIVYNQASPTEKSEMEAIWAEAGLGPFPHPTSS